jgi:phosphoglycerol transferase MdoB-like AlkP superfamily enzyme
MVFTSIIFVCQILLIFFYRRYRSVKRSIEDELSFITQWIINGVLWIGSTFIVMSSALNFDYLQLISSYSAKVWLISFIFIIPLYFVSTGLLGFYTGNFSIALLLYLLAMGNYLKILIRGDALLSVDLSVKQLKEMSQSMLSETLKSTVIVVGAILILLTLLFLFFLLRYHTKENKKRWITRSIILSFGFLSLLSLSANAKLILSNAGVNTYLFSPKKSLQENGTVIHFVSRMGKDLMEKPAGYSKRKMEQIIRELQEKFPSQITQDSQTASPNVVFILSEAFWDPTKLSHVNWEKDPIPTIRNLIESNGGVFQSPEFGGNTANVEYNVITGFSSNFIKGGSVPYVSLDSSKDMPYTIVQNFNSLHYNTISVHPFEKTFYNRDSLFKKFGFETSIFKEEMKYSGTDNIGAYISDSSFVKEIIDLDKSENNPYYIHGISMQNHYPYSSDFKHGTKGFVKNSNGNKALEDLNRYANGLNETDKAIKELTDYYRKQEKETIVVFYGDHLPVLNEELLVKGLGKNPKKVEAAKHETEYFIWSNKKSAIISGEISANYLSEAAFKISGLPMSTFQQFLDNLRKQGTDLNQKEELEIYKLLQFDMIQGKKYSKELFEVQ